MERQATRPGTRRLGGPLSFQAKTTAVEQGRYSPSLEVAFKFAPAFGMPLDRVFEYPRDD